MMFTKHTKKSPVDSPLDSVIGARAWGAIPRSVLGIAPADPDDPEGERVLVQIKLNVDRRPPALVYTIDAAPHPAAPQDPTKSIAVVRWVRSDADIEARDVMGTGTAQKAAVPGSQLAKAVQFLEEALSYGPVKATDVEESADRAGVRGSLKRAKGILKVESFHLKPIGTFDNPSHWALPGKRSFFQR